MPLKKHKTYHKVHHEKHRRSKKFLKVYAPYIPLLLVVGLGVWLSGASGTRRPASQDVLSYTTSVSRQGLLEATNSQRAKDGDMGLSLNTKLSQAAQAKAQDMASQDYWAHSSPDGRKPWYFIKQSGYRYSKAAENLAYGFNNSQSIVIGWMNSPEHRSNLLDDNLRDVGFGIINIPDYQDSGPQTLIVAMYGRPSETGAASNQNAVLSSDQSRVTYIEALSGGRAPWSGFLAGLLLGLAIMYLLIKHLRQLRRVLLAGEKFVIKHPILDATLVAVIVLAAILSRTVGFIQ